MRAFITRERETNRLTERLDLPERSFNLKEKKTKSIEETDRFCPREREVYFRGFFEEPSAFIRRMSPGEGYGRIWNSSPLAVSSAPVFALPFRSRPEAQLPLERQMTTPTSQAKRLTVARRSTRKDPSKQHTVNSSLTLFEGDSPDQRRN